MNTISFFNYHRERVIIAVITFAVLAAAQPLAAAGPGVQGLVFALDDQGKITGIVPGAAIELKNQAGQAAGHATSDAKGFYRIDLSPGAYFYKVQAAGFRDENVGRGIQLKLTEGYSVYNFSLTKGKNDPSQKPPQTAAVQIGKLEGKVLEKTSDGKLIGIPGAAVSLRAASTDRHLTTAIAGGQAGGDTAGHYEISLAAGAWQGSASAPGLAAADPSSIEIKDGQTTTHDFILTRNVPPPVAGKQGIRGTVCVRDPKLPAGTLPPVKISIVPLNPSGVSASAPSADGQGQYSQDLQPGGYQVAAEAQGYRPARSGSKAVFPTKYTIVDLTLVPEPVPQQPLTFEGTVYEQTGDDVSTKHPLASATVQVRRQGGTAEANPAQAQTDGEGRVQLTISGGLGEYQAIASMTDYRSQTINLQVQDASEHHSAEFILSKAKSLSFVGTVYEQTGDDVTTKTPLKNATVDIRRLGNVVAGPAQTDDQGNAKLMVFPGDYQAEGSMSGLGSQTLGVIIREGGQNHAEFVLKKSPGPLSVEGTVYGQTGEDRKTMHRLPGATVQLVQDKGPPNATGAGAVQHTTDKQGQVQLDVPAGPGNYQAIASMTDYSSQTINLAIGQGEHHAAEFLLIKKLPPLSFEGIVYQQQGNDTTTKTPLPDANVRILKQDDSSGAGPVQGATLPDGHVDLKVATGPGAYQATAGKPNVGSQTLNVVLRPRGDNRAEFVLIIPAPSPRPGPQPQPEQNLTFNCIVYTQESNDRSTRKPASGASVQISKDGRTMQHGTGGDGTVQLSVPAGPGNYQAEARLPGYKPSRIDVKISAGGENRGAFVLIREAPPMFEATVLERTGDDVSSTRLLPGAAVRISKQGQIAQHNTGPDGKVLLNVPAGPGAYQAEARMKDHELTGPVDVVIRDAGVTTHTFILTPKKPLSIEVTVIEKTGDNAIATHRPSNDADRTNPLSGVKVHVSQQGAGTGSADGPTDSQGVVRLAASAGPGNYEAKAQAQGYEPGSVVIAVRDGGENRGTIVLKKKQLSFNGQVINDKKNPVSGAKVRISQQGTGAGSAEGSTDGKGWVQLAILAGPGNYEAKALSDGYEPGVIVVPIRDDIENTGTIVLKTAAPKKATLTVIVSGQKDGATNPLIRASVQISQNNRQVGAGQTDSSGHYTIQLAPGAYRIHVTESGYPGADVSVKLGPDGSQEKIVLHAANIQ